MKTEQRIFTFTDYPDDVAKRVSRLIDKGYTLQSISTSQSGSNIHQVHAFVICSVQLTDEDDQR